MFDKTTAHGWLTVVLILFLAASCGDDNSTGDPPLGSVSNPIDLGVVTIPTTTPATHNGVVGAGGAMYYKFTTGTVFSYLIGLTETESNLDWTLYSSPDFSTGEIWTCDFNGTAEDEVCSTPSVLTAHVTYYLAVYEKDDVTSSYKLSIPPVL